MKKKDTLFIPFNYSGRWGGGGGRGRSSVSKSVSRESCRARVADIIGGGGGGGEGGRGK